MQGTIRKGMYYALSHYRNTKAQGRRRAHIFTSAQADCPASTDGVYVHRIGPSIHQCMGPIVVYPSFSDCRIGVKSTGGGKGIL